MCQKIFAQVGDSAWDAYGGRVGAESTLVHDTERSHSVLVGRLGLASEAHDSGSLRGLPDRDNSLRDVNRLCYLLEPFLNFHSGFDREDIRGWLDVFWVRAAPRGRPGVRRPPPQCHPPFTCGGGWPEAIDIYVIPIRTLGA